jgi:hypothetical protein
MLPLSSFPAEASAIRTSNMKMKTGLMVEAIAFVVELFGSLAVSFDYIVSRRLRFLARTLCFNYKPAYRPTQAGLFPSLQASPETWL